MTGAGSRGTNALLATEGGDSELGRSMGTRARSTVLVLDDVSSLLITDLFFLQTNKAWSLIFVKKVQVAIPWDLPLSQPSELILLFIGSVILFNRR